MSFNSQFTEYVSRCVSLSSPIVSHPIDLELKPSAHQTLTPLQESPQNILSNSTVFVMWISLTSLAMFFSFTPSGLLGLLSFYPFSQLCLQKIQKPG